MKFAIAVFFLFALVATGFSQKYSCLPADVTGETVVGSRNVTSANGIKTTEKTTVKQALGSLRARCFSGKLVDRHRKQIRFYHMKGCWGYPPPDYLEIMEQQRKDIANLKKLYTVIEVTCDPGGSLQRIS